MYEEHEKVKRGNQSWEMQDDIEVLTMEKNQLIHELNCTRSKLDLYDRLFRTLIGILIIICVLFGMKVGI